MANAMVLPKQQTALVGEPDGTYGISKDVPMPELEADMVLVRNHATAMNPVDVKLMGKLATPGAVAGMDFAGIVVDLGSSVKSAGRLQVGDRVCGAVMGMHALSPLSGAFAQYVAAVEHVVLKIPDTMTFVEAASIGSGVGTVGMALFHSLKIPGWPLQTYSEKVMDILVYGGSTSTGTLAIQLAKLSGLKPITTCSPHNFELVKSYGAESVFDYRSSSCIDDIKKATRNSLKFVIDCVSEPETMQFCYACIGRTGGRYTALEPYPESLCTRKTIKPDWVLGPKLLGRRIDWGPQFQLDPDLEAKEFAVKWFKTVQELLDANLFRTHPLQEMYGGFDGTLEGLELLRTKQVSGQKLVCQIPS